MPTNNNNSVKPIMVDACATLTELEEYWKNIAETETADQTNHYATIDDLLAVCKRLRKEVKRHKKTKRYAQELFGNLTVAEDSLVEHKQELIIEREQLSAKHAEIAALKQELAALREKHYGDNPGL